MSAETLNPSSEDDSMSLDSIIEEFKGGEENTPEGSVDTSSPKPTDEDHGEAEPAGIDSSIFGPAGGGEFEGIGAVSEITPEMEAECERILDRKKAGEREVDAEIEAVRKKAEKKRRIIRNSAIAAIALILAGAFGKVLDNKNNVSGNGTVPGNGSGEKPKTEYSNPDQRQELPPNLTPEQQAVYNAVYASGTGGDKATNEDSEQQSDSAGGEDAAEIEESHESISEKSTYHGMFASEDGSTYNGNKAHRYCFGESLPSNYSEDGKLLPEEERMSEDDMKDELASRMTQLAQLASTYRYMQAKTTNPKFGVEGAGEKTDNPNDLVEAMKNDPELHQRVYDFVVSIITDDGSMQEKTVDGYYHNAYMDSKFENGDADKSKVEIKDSYTNEKGTKVYVKEYRWIDDQDNWHVDILIFKERCGGQPLDQIDFQPTVEKIADPEPEPIPQPKPQPKPQPQPEPEPQPQPEPEPEPELIKPKDKAEMVRIDSTILDDIAKDTGSTPIEFAPTAPVESQTITSQPSTSEYQNNNQATVENKPSTSAETVGVGMQDTTEAPANQINSANDYSGDKAQANLSIGPAKEDTSAPAEEVNPVSGVDMGDFLSQFGIENN